MQKQSENLRIMIKRKQLLRDQPPGYEEVAERLLSKVEQNGGLTPEELYSLMAY